MQPYTRSILNDGLDTLDVRCIADLRAIDLKPWARREGYGAHLRSEASPSDCYVCDIPPGKGLAEQPQSCEEIVLILEGRGSTSVRDDEGVCTSFEWRAGSLFSVPRARSVRHFNGSGRDRVRFVAITAYPTNASGVPAAAAAGAAGSGDDRVGFELKNALSSDAALVFELQDCVMLDALECPLLAVPHCGVGGHLSSPMGTRGLTITLSQLPPGTYGMAHAYGPGALTIVLAGEGYTLLWPEGARPGRQPWRPGSLVSAAGGWWRQHFNPGRSPARFVTLAPASALLPDVSGMARIWTSTRHGGTRIDYADEAAEIRAGFAVAVQAAGGDVRMPVVCGEREQ